MTAAEVIAAADALRPNQYSPEQKLAWLRELDAELWDEMRRFLEPDGGVPETYRPEDGLLAPPPYDRALYVNWLFCRMDYHNGEISRYNQSAAMFREAQQALLSFWNRSRRPGDCPRWKL